jgi:hypothetical protein
MPISWNPVTQPDFDPGDWVTIGIYLRRLARSLKTWAIENSGGTIIVRDPTDSVVVRFYKIGKLEIDRQMGGIPLKSKTKKILDQLEQMVRVLKHTPRTFNTFPHLNPVLPAQGQTKKPGSHSEDRHGS